MGDALTATTVQFNGDGGDQIEGYLARPLSEGSRGGVVVIHHLPGYDRSTKEIVRRFSELGYDALCPNLYYREAPDADPADAAAMVRAGGGVPDDRLVGDVGAAVDYLRGLDTANGKVGVIGYCSGGRQTVLAACSLPVDAAVDCYGAFVIGNAPEASPVRMTGLEDKLPDLNCPLLGLFGAEDQHPSPADVARLEQLLTEHGKTFELHSYADTGHSFFSNDRPAYRVEAANDGWEKIEAFYATNLSG
jgi:carboxymethylenebutenolidase